MPRAMPRFAFLAAGSNALGIKSLVMLERITARRAFAPGALEMAQKAKSSLERLSCDLSFSLEEFPQITCVQSQHFLMAGWLINGHYKTRPHQVDSLAVAASLDQLQTSVRPSSKTFPASAEDTWPHWVLALLDARGLLDHRAGDAEINELELSQHAQKVGGLQVAVHDALLVNAMHRLQHLLQERT